MNRHSDAAFTGALATLWLVRHPAILAMEDRDDLLLAETAQRIAEAVIEASDEIDEADVATLDVIELLVERAATLLCNPDIDGDTMLPVPAIITRFLQSRA